MYFTALIFHKTGWFESLYIQITKVNCDSSSFEERIIYVTSVATLFAKQPCPHYIVFFLQTECKKEGFLNIAGNKVYLQLLSDIS